MGKRFKVVNIQTPNGEVHYILRNLEVFENSTNANNLDAAEVKASMRKEARKPLYLLRSY